MRKLARKGFALVMLMAFMLAMGVMTDAAMAADKMPVGPMKILVGPIHGGVRLC